MGKNVTGKWVKTEFSKGQVFDHKYDNLLIKDKISGLATASTNQNSTNWAGVVLSKTCTGASGDGMYQR